MRHAECRRVAAHRGDDVIPGAAEVEMPWSLCFAVAVVVVPPQPDCLTIVYRAPAAAAAAAGFVVLSSDVPSGFIVVASALWPAAGGELGLGGDGEEGGEGDATTDRTVGMYGPAPPVGNPGEVAATARDRRLAFPWRRCRTVSTCHPPPVLLSAISLRSPTSRRCASPSSSPRVCRPRRAWRQLRPRRPPLVFSMMAFLATSPGLQAPLLRPSSSSSALPPPPHLRPRSSTESSPFVVAFLLHHRAIATPAVPVRTGGRPGTGFTCLIVATPRCSAWNPASAADPPPRTPPDDDAA